MIYKFKPGALSNEDMKFIRENYLIMAIPEIAESLNRREEPIKRFLDDNGLISMDVSADEEDVYLRAELLSENFWPELHKQFTINELKYFASMWVSMVKQFQSDILPSEKLQLKKFITYEILRDRVLEKNSKHINEINDFEKKVKTEYKKRRDERDSDLIRSLTDQIVSMRASLSNSVRELNDYSKEQNVIAKELKASRSDRISNIQDAEKNWVSLIKLLENDIVRKKIGTHIEIMRVAQEKAKNQLYNFHEFIDKRADIPILDEESVKQLEN
jgi:membrane-associated HD superfamily phosphohydrolase